MPSWCHFISTVPSNTTRRCCTAVWGAVWAPRLVRVRSRYEVNIRGTVSTARGRHHSWRRNFCRWNSLLPPSVESRHCCLREVRQLNFTEGSSQHELRSTVWFAHKSLWAAVTAVEREIPMYQAGWSTERRFHRMRRTCQSRGANLGAGMCAWVSSSVSSLLLVYSWSTNYSFDRSYSEISKRSEL